jgi:hypothetical protein
MLNGWTDRAWVARVIEDIQRGDVAEVTTVVIDRSPPASFGERLKAHLSIWLFSLYYRLDRWIFRRLLKVRYDAFEPVDLRPLLKDATVLEVVPLRKKFTDRFDDDTVRTLREQDLDVIFRFGFRIIRGPILETARYGVWSFHHGDNREYRGTPPSFWEMYEGNPVCGVTLQILTDQLDGGKTIHRSVAKTNAYSLYVNNNRNYWNGTEAVGSLLSRLRDAGFSSITELETYREQLVYDKPIYKVPRTWTMLKFLARLAARGAQRTFTGLCTEEHWFVAWRKRPRPMQLRQPGEGEPYRVLLPPRGYFYADPFPIEHEGRHYILFEDYCYAESRGVLSWIELDEAGNPSEPHVFLDLDCHLSYPFVFKHEGQIYMIPETRDRRRIELWCADGFPNFVFDRVVMDNVNCVDATWLAYRGKYWLFTSLGAEQTLTSDELHVFWSDAPFGPWTPHAQNPVKTTTRGARPAGKVFELNGELIRPGQDGARIYGHQVRFHRIEQLSESEYRESEIAVFGPEWYPGNIGTHTYNFDDKYEIIDGRVRVLRSLRRRPRPQSFK